MRTWRATNVGTNAGAGTHPFRMKTAGGWKIPGTMGRSYAVPPENILKSVLKAFLRGGSAQPKCQKPVVPREESV